MSSDAGEDLGYASANEERMSQPGDMQSEAGLLEEEDRFETFMTAVQSLVNALGGYETVRTAEGKIETIYRPGDSVLAVLKDLKKLWRKDDADDERTVARCMAKAGLMKELLALLVECSDRGDWGRKVSLVACDLIAALTWPIDVQQELKEMEDEPDVVTDYASLLRTHVGYKAMILQTDGPLRCILGLLLPSLARPRKDEKDAAIISLGLHIIRNLASIKDIAAEGTATGEKEELANLQSTLIVQLQRLTYFDLLLTLASSADKTEFNQFNVLVLDILHLVFRGVKPRDLGQDQARAPMENLSKLLVAERKNKAMKARGGMSRHSRFGTTVSVKAGDQRIVLHKQNSINVNPGLVLDEVKRKRAGRMKKTDELNQAVNLSPDAMRLLQNLAKTFLQSCFNTFFSSIMRDIRMERSKIRPTDNVRCFYLARFFIEYLLILRRKESSKNPDLKGQVPVEADLSLGLVAEMAEMDSVRWVVMRLKYAMDDKPPAWKELQASLDCFTQILLLIEAMSLSNEEEDNEVAGILQDQLYYNGDILDSCLQVISNYKDQSIGYLDSVVHFAYVLLRLLEKYSKNKSYMFVRKRKAARKKKNDAQQANGTQADSTLPEEYAGDEENEEDMLPDKDAPSYAEHAFTFQTFEQRFACEAVVNTLVQYLARFKEFDEADQMKRVVGLMHRQVVKTQAEGLYFKVSCLNLFRRILDDQSNQLKEDQSKDLVQLVNFVLKKFFKKITEDPFVIVSALGPKTRGHWKEISSYKSDEEDDDGMGGQKARILEKLNRAPAELEFKKNKNLSWSQQMGVVVAMLVQAEHQDWIEWIIEMLELALATRTEIVLTTDGAEAFRDDDSDDDEVGRVRNFAGPSKDAIEKFQQYDVTAEENEERANALAKDAHLRLMLKLLSFDRTDEEKALEQRWFLPASILPSNISTSLGALRNFLLDPPSLDDDPKTMLRKIRVKRARRESFSGSDEDRPKKVRKRKAAETQIYKSAAFIDDSDDDEETDLAFFEREKRLREEMNAVAEASGHVMLKKGKKKRRKGKGAGQPNGDVQASQLEEDPVDVRMDSDIEDGLLDDSEDGSVNGDGGDDESDVAIVSRKRGSSAILDDDEPAEGATQRKAKARRVVQSDSEDE